jgi:hypothetical protein
VWALATATAFARSNLTSLSISNIECPTPGWGTLLPTLTSASRDPVVYVRSFEGSVVPQHKERSVVRSFSARSARACRAGGGCSPEAFKCQQFRGKAHGAWRIGHSAWRKARRAKGEAQRAKGPSLLTPIRNSNEAQCPAQTLAERRRREAPGSMHRPYRGLWEFPWTGPHTEAIR